MRMGATRSRGHRVLSAPNHISLSAGEERLQHRVTITFFLCTAATPRVRLLRTSGRPLSRSDAYDAAARILRVSLGVLAGLAEVPARHDAADRGDRRVRGAALLLPRQHRRLALQGGAVSALGAGAPTLAAARGRARRQHPAGRAPIDDQAADALRQLPDAVALEFPPADAWAKHELLPGRVRGP